MARVTLEPMSPATYETWRASSVASYAAENVKSGRWIEDESLAQSDAEFVQLLPNGLGSPGNYLWTVRTSDGDDVGILWVSTDRRPGHAFIYDIEMDESRRGQGFGTSALEALEEWARSQGITSIGLHVFGHNSGAWKLYKRMGYVETSVQMEKHL
jgi:RimJ/RimL family protein N-acetyltransferase